MPEEITCKLRDKVGQGKARQLRRNGFIPAVLYGRGIDTVHLLLDEKIFHKTLSRIAGESVLIDLKVEEDKSSKKEASSRPVIIKEIQQDPVTNQILHVDFHLVRLTEKMRIKVPLSIKGEAPGVKAGGILGYSLREIEIECLPRDIPEKIEVNISNLEIGDVIHLKDLILPPKVAAVGDKETPILSIVPPKVEEVAPPPEEAITEPEVIGKREKEEEIEEEVSEEAAAKGKEKEPLEKPKSEK